MTDLPFSGTKRKKPPSFENGFMIQNRIKKAKKNGADDGARFSRCGARSFAALTVHRTVIQYRSYFEP